MNENENFIKRKAHYSTLQRPTLRDERLSLKDLHSHMHHHQQLHRYHLSYYFGLRFGETLAARYVSLAERAAESQEVNPHKRFPWILCRSAFGCPSVIRVTNSHVICCVYITHKKTRASDYDLRRIAGLTCEGTSRSLTECSRSQSRVILVLHIKETNNTGASHQRKQQTEHLSPFHLYPKKAATGEVGQKIWAK